MADKTQTPAQKKSIQDWWVKNTADTPEVPEQEYIDRAASSTKEGKVGDWWAKQTENLRETMPSDIGQTERIKATEKVAVAPIVARLAGDEQEQEAKGATAHEAIQDENRAFTNLTAPSGYRSEPSQNATTNLGWSRALAMKGVHLLGNELGEEHPVTQAVKSVVVPAKIGENDVVPRYGAPEEMKASDEAMAQEYEARTGHPSLLTVTTPKPELAKKGAKEEGGTQEKGEGAAGYIAEMFKPRYQVDVIKGTAPATDLIPGARLARLAYKATDAAMKGEDNPNPSQQAPTGRMASVPKEDLEAQQKAFDDATKIVDSAYYTGRAAAFKAAKAGRLTQPQLDAEYARLKGVRDAGREKIATEGVEPSAMREILGTFQSPIITARNVVQGKEPVENLFPPVRMLKQAPKIEEAVYREAAGLGRDVVDILKEEKPTPTFDPAHPSLGALAHDVKETYQASLGTQAKVGTAIVGKALGGLTQGQKGTEGVERGSQLLSPLAQGLNVVGSVAEPVVTKVNRAATRAGLAQSPLTPVGSLPLLQEDATPGQVAGRAWVAAKSLADPRELWDRNYWMDVENGISNGYGLTDVSMNLVRGLPIDSHGGIAQALVAAGLVADFALPFEEFAIGGTAGSLRAANRAMEAGMEARSLGGTAKEFTRAALAASDVPGLSKASRWGLNLPDVAHDQQAVIAKVHLDIAKRIAQDTGRVPMSREVRSEVRGIMEGSGVDEAVARQEFVDKQGGPNRIGGAERQRVETELDETAKKIGRSQGETLAAKAILEGAANRAVQVGQIADADDFYQGISFAHDDAWDPAKAAGGSLFEEEAAKQGLAPIFYSPLKKRVGEVFDKWNSKKPMPAEALLARVKAGVKQDELDWTGFEDWLKDRKEPVTREEAEKWAEQGQVRLGEVSLTPKTRPPLEGAELQRARESLFEQERTGLITREERQREWEMMSGVRPWKLDTPGGRAIFETYKIPGPSTNYRELVATLPRDMTATPYVSPHWEGIENPLFHIRMTDRVDANGNKVLFIDEVQSDWLQAAKKFQGQDIDAINEWRSLRARQDELLEVEIPAALKKYGENSAQDKALNAELRSIDEKLGDERFSFIDIDEAVETEPVPPAPFLDTWHELALKRILRYAAENGYDRVAFTTGDAIQNVVGGELAGQRAFYDQKVPNTLNKLGKKWGAQTETVGIDVGPHEGRVFKSFPSLPITDKMKQSVLHEGQALFQGEARQPRPSSVYGAALTKENLQKAISTKVLEPFANYMTKWMDGDLVTHTWPGYKNKNASMADEAVVVPEALQSAVDADLGKLSQKLRETDHDFPWLGISEVEEALHRMPKDERWERIAYGNGGPGQVYDGAAANADWLKRMGYDKFVEQYAKVYNNAVERAKSFGLPYGVSDKYREEYANVLKRVLSENGVQAGDVPYFLETDFYGYTPVTAPKIERDVDALKEMQLHLSGKRKKVGEELWDAEEELAKTAEKAGKTRETLRRGMEDWAKQEEAWKQKFTEEVVHTPDYQRDQARQVELYDSDFKVKPEHQAEYDELQTRYQKRNSAFDKANPAPPYPMEFFSYPSAQDAFYKMRNAQRRIEQIDQEIAVYEKLVPAIEKLKHDLPDPSSFEDMRRVVAESAKHDLDAGIITYDEAMERIRAVEADYGKELFQPGPGGTIRGATYRSATTGKLIAEVYKTGDFGTLLHENGHVLGLLFPDDGATLQKVTDIYSENGVFTRNSHERFAEDMRALMEEKAGQLAKVPPPARNILQAIRNIVLDAWNRIRGSRATSTIPPETRAMFERWWKAREEGARRTAAPTKVLPSFAGSKTGQVPMVSRVAGGPTGYAADVMKEANRVKMRDPGLAAAIGVKPGTMVDAGDFYEAVLHRAFANEARHKYPVELVAVTTRSVVPMTRLGPLRKKVRGIMESTLGMPLKEFAKHVDKKGLLRTDAVTTAGLQTLAKEIDSWGYGEFVPERLRQPGADWSYVTPQEFNQLHDAITDIHAGPASRRNRAIESLPTNAATAVLDALFHKQRILPGESMDQGWVRQACEGPIRAIEKTFTKENPFERLDPIAEEIMHRASRKLSGVKDEFIAKLEDINAGIRSKKGVGGKIWHVFIGHPETVFELVKEIVPPVKYDDITKAAFEPLGLGQDSKLHAKDASREAIAMKRPIMADPVKRKAWLDAVEAVFLDPSRGICRPLERERTAIVRLKAGFNDDTDISNVVAGLYRRRQAMYDRGGDIIASYMGDTAGETPSLPNEEKLKHYEHFYNGDYNWAPEQLATKKQKAIGASTEKGKPAKKPDAIHVVISMIARGMTDRVVEEMFQDLWTHRMVVNDETIWKDRLGKAAVQPRAAHNEAVLQEHLAKLGFKPDEYNDVLKAYQFRHETQSRMLTTGSWRNLVFEADNGERLRTSRAKAGTPILDAAGNPVKEMKAEFDLRYLSHAIVQKFDAKAKVDAAIADMKAWLKSTDMDEAVLNGPTPSPEAMDDFAHEVHEAVIAIYNGNDGIRRTTWKDVPPTAEEIADAKAKGLPPPQPKPEYPPDVSGQAINPEAWVEAHEFMDAFGIRPRNKTTEAPEDAFLIGVSPAGEKLYLPKRALESIQEVLQDSAPPATDFTSQGWVDRIRHTMGMTSKDPVGFKLWNNILGFQKQGMTCGGLIPIPPFFANQIIGNAWYAYMHKGFSGTAREVVASIQNPRIILEATIATTKGAPARASTAAAITKDGRIYTAQSLSEAALGEGLNSQFVGGEFLNGLDGDIQRYIATVPKIRDMITLGPYRRALVETSGYVDNVSRMITFWDELKQGKSESEAAAVARRINLDYSKLSEFERTTMRGTVLFYAYMRQNAANIWFALLHNPSRVMGQFRLAKGMNRIIFGEDASILTNDDTQARIAVWAKPSSRWGSSWTRWLLPPQSAADFFALPIDLLSIGHPTVTEHLLGRVNPMAQVGGMMAFGTMPSLGADASDPRVNKVPDWLVAYDNAIGGGHLQRFYDIRWHQETDTWDATDGAGGYKTVAAAGNWQSWQLTTKGLGLDRTIGFMNDLDRTDLGIVEAPLKLLPNANLENMGPRLATPRFGVGPIGEAGSMFGARANIAPSKEKVQSDTAAAINRAEQDIEKKRGKKVP